MKILAFFCENPVDQRKVRPRATPQGTGDFNTFQVTSWTPIEKFRCISYIQQKTTKNLLKILSGITL